jgi:hypothetical protein
LTDDQLLEAGVLLADPVFDATVVQDGPSDGGFDEPGKAVGFKKVQLQFGFESESEMLEKDRRKNRGLWIPRFGRP